MGAIELREVTRRFGTLTAVDAVSLEVADGEIVGLLGHNGAGKTTLIRLMNGLLRPDRGALRILGRDPVEAGRDVRRTTGVLTAFPSLDEFLTVVENLEIYASIHGVPRRLAKARIQELTERLGLQEKRQQPARELSAGLKQRVALARALVHDPQVLLLDEPTTNMDPVAARGVRDLVLEASQQRGKTVLLSTHNLAEAEEVCDRVAIMRTGRVLAVGPPGELRRSLGGTSGVRVQLADGDTSRAMEALGPRYVASVFDPVTIQVEGGGEVSEVVARLVAGGVPVHRVEPLEPTLEDLYLSLHRPGERPAASAGGAPTEGSVR